MKDYICYVATKKTIAVFSAVQGTKTQKRRQSPQNPGLRFLFVIPLLTCVCCLHTAQLKSHPFRVVAQWLSLHGTNQILSPPPHCLLWENTRGVNLVSALAIKWIGKCHDLFCFFVQSNVKLLGSVLFLFLCKHSHAKKTTCNNLLNERTDEKKTEHTICGDVSFYKVFVNLCSSGVTMHRFID